MVYFKLFRIKHLIKNGLIFFPLIFSLSLFNLSALFYVSVGFIGFSFLTSCVYVLNDLKDKQEDEKHPTKKYRPIACGKISPTQAHIFIVLLFLGANVLISGLAIMLNNFWIFAFFLLYFLNNLLYTYRLKQFPILDVFSIAIGFLLRVMFGAAIANVSVSPFLYLTVLAFAVYLGYGKRKGEYKNQHRRQVLNKYPIAFLEKSMTNCLSLTLVFYVLWALELGDNYLILKLTVPIILFILMRYNLVIEENSEADPIEVIYQDRPLLFSSGSYLFLLLFLLYF